MMADGGAVVERVKDLAEAEGPWMLPEGWATTKLEQIVERLTDGTHQPPKFTASGIPFVVIGNVSGDGIDWSSISKWVSPSTYLSESKRLRPSRDDVLYTAVGSYGLAIRVLDDREFMFQRHIAYLRPDKALVDPTYLCYALNSPVLRRQADRAARGVAQKTVTLGSLREFDIPLASLAEQRRIAARMNALFAEIADGEAALVAARKGLDIFRRALLKAAVTGELTKGWRAANPASETGHDVLARIAKARATKAPAKGRTGHNVDALSLDISALPTLPESWAWARVGEVISQMEYGTSEKCDFGYSGIPVLRMGNVDFGSLLYTKLKYAPKDTALPILQVGDLVFNRTNSAELVGKCAVYKGEVSPCSLASYLIRLRFDGISPDFAALWINSAYGRKWIATNKSQQVGQANLSGGTLRGMSIPIPPPDEAEEILRRVADALTATADTLTLLDAEAADAARLKQSTLKAAFEGRLVSQDPLDEPATALLSRLAANSLAMRAKRGRARKSTA
ncbi:MULTISPECIES: restriction endonuclease subunit S [unclassified Bradyrhizobium]|uniref:restriction endonuclease subunit S n=1 Tax=unclassified Bradyrhizobium TaxID=2631580 RepID=UPI002FF18AFB